MPNPTVEAIETRAGVVSYAVQGDGPPRLILHSLLTDRRAFDGVAGDLGGRVITVDLPGFGASESAPPEIDAYADRVAALVEALTLDVDDLVLIGNGLGAFVALGALIHHGGLFASAILVGVGTGFSDAAKVAFTNMIGAADEGGMEAVIPLALGRIFTEEFIAEHPDMGEKRAQVMRQTKPAAFIKACEALRKVDYSSLAKSVATPTMIVVGEDDQATPPLLAEGLHHLVSGSTLVRLPGIAHAPQLQDPGGFINAVRLFLEEK